MKVYLDGNRVKFIAPDDYPAEPDWVSLTVRDAVDGTPVGVNWTWDGVNYIAPPDRPEVANLFSLHAKAETALTNLRALRDSAGTFTAAQEAQHLRLLANVQIGVIRLLLNKLDADN